MSIVYQEKTKIFHLQTKNTSYVIQIFKGKYPVHLYWGKKVRGDEFGHLLRPVFRPFSPNPDPLDISYSPDALQLEYSSFGHSDFRNPSYAVEQTNGSTITDLDFSQYRIIFGKPPLKDLPATYVESGDEVSTLEIEMADPLNGLIVVLSYSVFEEMDAIVRSVRFVNNGQADLKLLRALSMSVDFDDSDFEMLQLSGSWARERHVFKRKILPGMQSVESARGVSSHQQNPFLALMRPGTGENNGDVFGFSLVYSGNFLAGAEVDQYDTTRVLIGIHPLEFSWLLEKGESFQTPEAVLVYSSDGLSGMSRVYHDLYRSRLCRGKYRDQIRPILVNNWEATLFDITEEKFEAFAKKGKELGVDLLVLDDGWFGNRNGNASSLGDWFVNEKKFPHGMKNLAEKINRMGMKFGLWFEPEMISVDSELYRSHPDWCIHVLDRTCSEGRHQLMLDLSRDEVCDAVAGMVSAMLSSVPIAYVKWDCNRYMTEAGSALLPPERQKETAHRFVLGLYKILEKLTSGFPEVLFESCAGGGGRFDPGMLYYMPQTWTSDNSDAMERLFVQYGTSMVYPAITMGCHMSCVPSHNMYRTPSMAFRKNMAMSGNFGYELDITQYTAEETAIVKTQIAEYKEIRHLVQFGDLFRLQSPFEGNQAAWMYRSKDKSEAFIVVFNILGEANAKFTRIYPKGLDPDRSYEIVGTGEVFGGDMLMHAGIGVPAMAGDFQSFSWHMKSVE